MRNRLVAAILLGATVSAYADAPGADWMTKEQVTRKLQAMGYTDIRKLEADDGHWEGDASKAGASYEIHVDPHTGALLKSEAKHADRKGGDDD